MQGAVVPGVRGLQGVFRAGVSGAVTHLRGVLLSCGGHLGSIWSGKANIFENGEPLLHRNFLEA